MSGLTHLDDSGAANMVDVGDKAETKRTAVAESFVTMQPETLRTIREGDARKGDVLGVARVAGIMAAKRTHDLIPLCHPLALTKVRVEFEERSEPPGYRIEATVALAGRTGVEMEALTAASIAALTIYDMAKAVDKAMEIGPTRLVSKAGGRSGDWRRG